MLACLLKPSTWAFTSNLRFFTNQGFFASGLWALRNQILNLSVSGEEGKQPYTYIYIYVFKKQEYIILQKYWNILQILLQN